MIETMKKNWFTLAEILIVVILFWMLAGIIMKTYTTISQVSFRIQQEKEIAKEALVLSQVLDNLAQSTTIDYDQYKSSDLVTNNGIVDTLYLSGDARKYQISSSKSCKEDDNITEKLENSDQSTEQSENQKNCQLLLTTTTGGQTTSLLDGQNFKLSKIKFKIIPFIWKKELKGKLQSESLGLNELPQDWKPAFRLLGTLYSNYYNPQKRTNNISLPLQLFFSLQGKTESLYSDTNTDDWQTPQA